MQRKPTLLLSTLCIVTWAGCATTTPDTPLSPAQQYVGFALRACDNAERQLPEMIRVAEIVADRHIRGGVIGFPRDAWYVGHGLEEELWGRSGQIIHVSFDRPWKKERTEAEKANDILIMGWRKEPNPGDLDLLRGFKARQCYLIGFGPRTLPALAEHAKLCDAWFDTGYGNDDRAVQLADGSLAGRGNLLNNALNAWALMGEVIAACTRRGRMPTIGKSFSYADGLEWWNRYFQKQQFHDEFQIAPIPRGRLGREYLDRIRALIRKYERTQLPVVNKTVDLIAAELEQGRKTVVAAMGHMSWAFVAKDEAVAWAVAPKTGLHYNLDGEVAIYNKEAPDGALVLRVGYSGHHREDDAILRKKRQRVMLITSENPRPEWQLPDDLLTVIDMGWEFGDACVRIPGYPIRCLPPSGVMQLVAYETINVEVLARIKGTSAVHP